MTERGDDGREVGGAVRPHPQKISLKIPPTTRRPMMARIATIQSTIFIAILPVRG
jgi:hypothetical protein